MGPDPYDDDLDDDGDDDVPTWDANNDGNATNDVREVPLWVNEDIVAVGSSSSSSDHRTMLIGPEMRRDRRRHMDDNDLRLVPGITLATWQNYTNNSSGSRIPTGDDEVLDRRLGLISDRITALRLEIIDYRGMVTRINVDAAAWPAPAPADGISYVLGGVAYTPPAPVAGQPDIWNASTRIIDGTWADGRNVPCPAYPTANLPNPALERPALIRVAFTLTDRVRNLSREFSFSFAPTAIQVQP
jgi:hypothetical protein